MQALARVRDVQEGRLVLSCETTAAACSACGGRGCALRWLAARDGVLDLPLQSKALTGLAPGDAVVVEVSETELLRAAALAYLLPLGGLLAGALAARVVAPATELAALVMAGAGLALGWAWSRARLRSRPPGYRVMPRGAQ